jgi:hypothetical protein
MKKYLHFDLVVGYSFAIAIIMVCQSVTIKAIAKPNNIEDRNIITPAQTKNYLNLIPVQLNKMIQTEQQIGARMDSLDFEVKVTKHRRFLLSFYKKQASDIFIKIYDVLGNLVHQERVSKKGKFKKEYDLSGYKTELYVIEVSDNNSAKAKRLFMG